MSCLKTLLAWDYRQHKEGLGVAEEIVGTGEAIARGLTPSPASAVNWTRLSIILKRIMRNELPVSELEGDGIVAKMLNKLPGDEGEWIKLIIDAKLRGTKQGAGGSEMSDADLRAELLRIFHLFGGLGVTRGGAEGYSVMQSSRRVLILLEDGRFVDFAALFKNPSLLGAKRIQIKGGHMVKSGYPEIEAKMEDGTTKTVGWVVGIPVEPNARESHPLHVSDLARMSGDIWDTDYAPEKIAHALLATLYSHGLETKESIVRMLFVEMRATQQVSRLREEIGQEGFTSVLRRYEAYSDVVPLILQKQWAQMRFIDEKLNGYLALAKQSAARKAKAGGLRERKRRLAEKAERGAPLPKRSVPVEVGAAVGVGVNAEAVSVPA